MFTVRGYFEIQGSPVFKVRIGPVGAASEEIEAVLDTGFNGFVSMPAALATQLQFKPSRSAAKVEMADGSVGSKPLAEAIVTLDSRNREGPVIIERKGNDVLLGMEFLKAFGLSLYLTPDAAVLFDLVEMMQETRSTTVS